MLNRFEAHAVLLAKVVVVVALTATATQAEESAGGGWTPSVSAPPKHDGATLRARQDLAARGITYGLSYTNDILVNVHGGTRQGLVDQGKIEGALTIDLEKAAGWQGLSLFANGFQIHNTGRFRRDYVGGINTIAAIEGTSTIRLSELWLEQKLPDGKTSIRFGQLAADVEFFFSGLSAMFLQSDWPTIAAVNLPSGGPAYPLSTPGVRLKFDPTASTSLLLAVLNGDPAGPGTGDEQLRNRYGLNFRTTDPALVIGEAQFRNNTGKEDTGRASTLKLGAWGHFGSFEDRRIAVDGTLLADPGGSGQPKRHTGNAGVYGVVEQQLYRPRGGDAESGISVYGRISASPSDRNLVDFYLDGGIVFAGLILDRPDDRFGVGLIYSRFSDGVRGFDRDLASFGITPTAFRDFEANVELSYHAHINPNLVLQPTVQYVWHPNGDAGRDALVVGTRAFWRY